MAWSILLGMQAVATTVHAGEVRAIPVNDHVVAFFDGRAPEGSEDLSKATWATYGANVATYAIYDGNDALIYDTYPTLAQAKQVRDYLEKRGIKRFIVVNSHWHLDHVGGNAVYSDSTIIATERTREQLIKHKGAIENGTLQGPPAIVPLMVPDVGIVAPVTVAVGRYSVELHPVNVHSADSLVAFMPQERLLLAGDTMEDTITFIAEPENLVQHYRNLAKMRSWGIARILPNHGDPDVIARGGYGPALIEVTRQYIRALVESAHDPDFLSLPIEQFIRAGLQARTVSIWWAYREAHRQNLAKVAASYAKKPLPRFGP